jgi:orotidine-5'-phosphate decarboxylase
MSAPASRLAVVAVTVTHFADELAAAVERKRSQLVVGLDPVFEQLPVELRDEEPAAAFTRFCCGIVDAVASHAVAVKPQSAFFEALGADGVRSFEEVCHYARAAGLSVIADVKRGDIGSTARAYAQAFAPIADAITINPYLGSDSVEPFLEAGAVFCLVKTSNPGSGDIQDVELADGRKVWQHVAGLVREWGERYVGESGLSSVGAVVGATYPREVAQARELMPRSILLLPGVGAQGGKPSDLAAAFANGPAGGLVSASRSVIYAYRESGGDWRAAAGAEAERLAQEIWRVSAA